MIEILARIVVLAVMVVGFALAVLVTGALVLCRCPLCKGSRECPDCEGVGGFGMARCGRCEGTGSCECQMNRD